MAIRRARSGLEIEEEGGIPLGLSVEQLRQQHVGRLLLLGSRVFERLAMRLLIARGFADLRLTHLTLIRAIPVEGIRTTEIAEVAGMTKQAVGQLAIQLEAAGYVVRMSDPTDGRAKLVRFAARGLELFAALPDVLITAESQMEQVMGHADFIVLRRGLRRLITNMIDDL